MFADVLLPLSIPQYYTYEVPDELKSEVAIGKRAIVQFGPKRFYTALIRTIHDKKPQKYRPKPLLEIPDKHPIAHEKQFQLWEWIASYYMATPGEVMNAALPASFKLSSQTKIVANPVFDISGADLTDDEFLVAEALSLQHELSLSEVQDILQKKVIYPVVESLLYKNALFLHEEIKEKFKPKKELFVKISDEYKDKQKLKNAFNELERAPKQLQMLMSFIQLSRKEEKIKKSALLKEGKFSASVLKALEDKNILVCYEEEIDRISAEDAGNTIKFQLTEHQQQAYQTIKSSFEEKDVVLLYGVTSSGKTQLYMQLIQDMLEQGKQILYLLPEIALTAQIINRLKQVFGGDVGIYHSKFSNNERVEIWNKVLNKEYKIILGARSAVFLPFCDLGLIIVDEEHDPSFKQFDPAPRYHARDTAVYMAQLLGVKTLLGTATPSVESFYNAKTEKYGLATLSERYLGMQLPEVEPIDLKDAIKRKQLKSHFSVHLLDALEQTLAAGGQAILFQNRRGFAPFLICTTCSWIPQCRNCDISLTYHKYQHELRCHYCGYKEPSVQKCSACGSTGIQVQGFGTEKVEEELKIFFPKAIIDRLDYDRIRTKTAHAKIIQSFEEGKIDILVGTQMVTKGLDFDNVSLVGILSAEHLLSFPDFRANERAFQLMMQVSGRAGRKNKPGKVLIQTYNPGHHIVQEVILHDFNAFYEKELQERRVFNYPPFCRLIKIVLKHKKADVVNKAAYRLANALTNSFGKNLLGPAIPAVGRVRNYYLMEMTIKLQKGTNLPAAKEKIKSAIEDIHSQKSFKSIRINADVDPY